MNKSDKKKNFETYMANLKKRDPLPPAGKNIPTIKELVDEGNSLLEQDTKSEKKSSAPAPAKTLESALGATDKNPYIRARIQVLKKLPLWKQKEIEAMERDGNINNNHYDEFVKLVAEAGDKLSEENSHTK